MRCVGDFAVIALLVLDNELDLEGLLQHCVAVNLFLDSEFDLYPSRMRLCPDERRVEQFNKFKALNVFQAQ